MYRIFLLVPLLLIYVNVRYAIPYAGVIWDNLKIAVETAMDAKVRRIS